MNPYRSPVALAVLIALQGCITHGSAPSVVEQNQSPERIEQVYLDGRLQFVVCQDCPVITSKQMEDEEPATASVPEQKMSGNDAAPAVPAPAAPAPEEPYKKLSEWKGKGVVDALLNGDLYTLPQQALPAGTDPVSANKPEKTEPMSKADDAKIDSLLAQAVAEKKSLETISASVKERKALADASNSPEKQAAEPVKLVASDAPVTQKDTAGTVNFGFNQKKIDDKTQQELEQILPQAMNAGKLVLNGYTDSVGSKAYNDVLAMQRAINTKQVLRKMGINIEIDVSGEGNCCYLASNDTEEGRAKNRRVEINVIGSRKHHTASTEKPAADNYVNQRSL